MLRTQDACECAPRRNSHRQQVPAHTTIVPELPRVLSENDSEQQQLGEEAVAETDPYLAGFMDGMAAANANANANANRNASEINAPLTADDPRTPWPHQVTLKFLNPLTSPPSFWPPPQSHGLHYTAGASSSQSQDFPSDDQRQEWPSAPDLLPDITASDISNDLSQFDPSTLASNLLSLDDEDGCFHNSCGTATSSANQSPPAVLPGLTGPQLNSSAPNEPQAFAPGVAQSQSASTSKFVRNRDLPRNVVPTSEIAALNRIGTSFDASTRAPLEVSANRVKLLLNASPHATRHAERQRSSVPASPAGVSKRAADGSVLTVFRAYGSRRSKFDEESRKRTALTRKLGACATCREKKLRCDQSSKEKFVPCSRCAKLSPHLLPGPCCRIELVDIKLFRLGSAATPGLLQQWILSKEPGKGTLLLENGTVAFEPPRQVYLALDVNKTSFAVSVSRFQPGVDDATTYVWTDAAGNKKEWQLPPYYISDMAEAGKNMRRQFGIWSGEFSTALLVNSNPIVRKTFKEAERYYKASKSELVATALMFWSATRLIERTWLICGTDLLGLPPMEHNVGPCRRNPYMNAVPVTPVMDTQLDELSIECVLIPLRAKLLRLLKAKMLAKKKEHWYEIYLASFIVLHNMERILDHIVDFGRRFGISADPKSNDEASLSHAYYHACKTILAYFHFASGGAAPLSLDWLDRARDTSIMTRHQIAYLREMQEEILRQDAQLQTLKSASMYQTELYWVHQVLLPGWKADIPHRGKFLEFTEKDLLCT